MGFLDKLKIKKNDEFSDIETNEIEKKEPIKEVTQTRPALQSNSSDMDNLRAKMDLILTEIDSLKTQNKILDKKLDTIEKVLSDMKGIRYY